MFHLCDYLAIDIDTVHCDGERLRPRDTHVTILTFINFGSLGNDLLFVCGRWGKTLAVS